MANTTKEIIEKKKYPLFQCQHCVKTRNIYQSFEEFLHHIKIKHARKKDIDINSSYIVKCSECDMEIGKTEMEIEYHMKNEHFDTSGPMCVVKCTKCQKNHVPIMQKHMKTMENCVCAYCLTN